jgi:hypothetical protein
MANPLEKLARLAFREIDQEDLAALVLDEPYVLVDRHP